MPVRVRRGERVGDLDGDLAAPDRPAARRVRAASASVSPSSSSMTRNAHRRRRLARPDVVERADVRMRQLRDGPRLALEALAAARVVGEIAGEHLDRDVAIEPRVARAIDLAHAAGAERPEDLERAEPAARTQSRRCAVGCRRPWHAPASLRNPSASACAASSDSTSRTDCPRRRASRGRETPLARPAAAPARGETVPGRVPNAARVVMRRHLAVRDTATLRASAQSRLTVIGAMPNTAAVSSTVSPPKKRSSTSRHWRSSIAGELVERDVEGQESTPASLHRWRRCPAA